MFVIFLVGLAELEVYDHNCTVAHHYAVGAAVAELSVLLPDERNGLI